MQGSRAEGPERRGALQDQPDEPPSPLRRPLDRRGFMRVAGTGAAGIAVAGGAAAIGARARRPDGPNVLVIVMDTVRADHVGAYGNRWIRTPNLDALARESLRFTRGFPEAMPTVPARRSMLKGRRVYPWTDWKPTRNLPGSPGWAGFSASEHTWLKTLRRHGYWTGYVSDNPFLSFAPSWHGLRDTLDRYVKVSGQVGARHPASAVPLHKARHWLPRDMRTTGHYLQSMRQYLANMGAALHEAEEGASRVFGLGVDYLKEAARHRPFALVVDSFDPHEPWVPMRKYRDLYGDPHYRGTEPGNVRYRPSSYMTEQELERLPTVYAAALTQADAQLGHFLERFWDSGLADETVLVFMSDHGIVLGERGWTGKPANQLHPELIHVPFLLRGPQGRRAGETSRYFVSPHDIGPTVLAACGVQAPSTMNGSDLTPLLRGSQPKQKRPFWYGGYANHWYYRDDRWAMIADGLNRGRALYDLRKDPGEMNSIAADHIPLMERIYRRVLHDTGLTHLPYFGRRAS